MRLIRVSLPLLLAALLLALSGAAWGGPHYFCRMAGRVVEKCCCSHGAAESCPQALGAADCCERIGAAERAFVGRTPVASESVPPAALLQTLDEPAYRLVASRARGVVLARGRAPPVAPRLFALHCVFLI